MHGDGVAILRLARAGGGRGREGLDRGACGGGNGVGEEEGEERREEGGEEGDAHFWVGGVSGMGLGC